MLVGTCQSQPSTFWILALIYFVLEFLLTCLYMVTSGPGGCSSGCLVMVYRWLCACWGRFFFFSLSLFFFFFEGGWWSKPPSELRSAISSTQFRCDMELPDLASVIKLAPLLRHSCVMGKKFSILMWCRIIVITMFSLFFIRVALIEIYV
jgi:hypothetical protein